MAGATSPTARVTAGILITRLLGFVRERAIAHYIGSGVPVDAYRAALRIPNVVRNLLGEGTLSASFIPVYAALERRQDPKAARALANAVAGLLLLVTGVSALVGVLVAPIITRVVAPGFGPEARPLTTLLVRLLFPVTAVMVLSAWCLSILTTHRRFFLPYAAPALWNVAGIAALVGAGIWLAEPDDLVVALAWGLIAGGVLQVGVQIPPCVRVLKGLRPRVTMRVEGVREVVHGWIPVVIGAGVMQISSVIDTQLGSLVGVGAVAHLGYAQLLQILPVSLFGVSVAAVALPELSRDAASEIGDTSALRQRLGIGLRRIAFFVLPAAVLYSGFGPVLVGTLFETGQFSSRDTIVVGGVLAAYGIGIWAQASIRLLASGYYAQRDTRTPVKIAAAAIVVSTALAILFMRWFGAAGIALGSALGAYVNAALLLRGLDRRLGRIVTQPIGKDLGRGVVAAGLGGAAGWAALSLVPKWPVVASGILLVVIFGLVYAGTAVVLGHPEARRSSNAPPHPNDSRTEASDTS